MEKFGEWVPITYREMTDEDKQARADKLGVDPEELADHLIFTCEMPEDEQQIIITTKWHDVFMTVYYSDPYDGSYFECYEDIGDALAWMPAPEPFSNSEAENEQTK